MQNLCGSRGSAEHVGGAGLQSLCCFDRLEAFRKVCRFTRSPQYSIAEARAAGLAADVFFGANTCQLKRFLSSAATNLRRLTPNSMLEDSGKLWIGSREDWKYSSPAGK